MNFAHASSIVRVRSDLYFRGVVEGCVMKIEFESVLFGLAFLVLALISMPGKPQGEAAQPTAGEQTAAASPASDR